MEQLAATNQNADVDTQLIGVGTGRIVLSSSADQQNNATAFKSDPGHQIQCELIINLEHNNNRQFHCSTIKLTCMEFDSVLSIICSCYMK